VRERARVGAPCNWCPDVRRALVEYLSTIVGSDEAAQDAAQEAFVRLWEHRDRWEEVAHGELPFEVRTAVGTITVVGTRFEVSTGPDELRVVVVEGTVRLSDGRSAVRVTAEQVAFLRQGSSPRILERADIWSFLDWSGGLLIFQATPLRQVADEVGRHFGLTVRITDDEIGSRRVTASFEDESAEEVVSAVCLVVDARCEMDGAEVTIGR
jgi:transmembrane sensor